MQRKIWIWAVLAVLALGVVGLVLRARAKTMAHAGPPGSGAPGGGPAPSGSASPEDRVVSVVLTTVEARDMPIYLEGLGSVSAFNTVTVKPQVEGRIDKVAFKEGQDVKKGDLLVQIDPRPYTILLHTAQAALARDQATLAGKKRTFERDSALLKEGLATQALVDDDRTAVETAEAVLKSDYAQIENARLQLDYARVTAPLDGVTGARLVDAGNVVRPGDPTGLVVITQVDPIAVFFSLPQDDLPEISKEMAQGKLTVEAWDRDGTSKIATGELVLIDNQINAQTATIRLKATFENADRRLWPNQFVKARLLLATRKGARVVPAAAVQRGPQGMFVYVVGPDMKAAVRPVQVERTEGDQTILASGVNPGDPIVADGMFQLRPGSKVAPKPAGTGGPGPRGSGAPAGSGAPGGGPPGGAREAGSGAPAGSAAPAGSGAGAPR
jgi:multidrug efflux system membrane fusion protein